MKQSNQAGPDAPTERVATQAQPPTPLSPYENTSENTENIYQSTYQNADATGTPSMNSTSSIPYGAMQDLYGGSTSSQPSEAPTIEVSPMPGSAEVPVRTKKWCTIVMVFFAAFMNIVQASYAGLNMTESNPWFFWPVLGTLLAIPAAFMLLVRNTRPVLCFFLCCASVVLFPFDSLIALMALTALLARRKDPSLTIIGIVAASAVTVWCQVRDLLRLPDSSLWHLIFARPQTGSQYNKPLELLVSPATMVTVALIVAAISVVISVLAGLQIRQRALAHQASAQAEAAHTHATQLQQSLDSQQFADAVAAEAHDTLAHSLSLLALNASALQTQAQRLQQEQPQDSQSVQSLVTTAEDIRKQAAGALDEAHSIIDMLRHPEQASELLAPSQETALTRESLDALIGDSQYAGMRINTWIDVQQLGSLDDSVGKIAYRVLQESLTNARRHAQGAAVSLQLDASPRTGIVIHVSNPQGENSVDSNSANDLRSGEGLASLRERVQSVHGVSNIGEDAHHVFHVDVRIPWVTKKTVA